MKTAGPIILASLVLLVSDARAQEASFPLSVEGASAQLQRTPALIIHEVIAPPSIVKNASAAALKTQGAPPKNAASKSSAAGAPSVTPASQPIVFPTSLGSGEMGSTGNPKYDALIAQSAARHGVDPNLILAVMRQESGFKSQALSYKGASGLMQLMPGTARRFGVTN
ncbi:MAG TPA: transglycosylase SLT domain-containing protein, partial [Blastocatellia bacterium]|nr:transglycosylase SLT domain-containing protein [Blastocatellia bacterium]